MAEDDVMNGMKRAGRTLTAAVAGTLLLTGCETPLLSVRVHHHTASDASTAPAAPTTVPSADYRSGNNIASTNQGQRMPDGAVLQRYQIPDSNQTLDFIVKEGGAHICPPLHSAVAEAKEIPNRTFSITTGGPNTKCASPSPQTTGYASIAPLRLPDNARTADGQYVEYNGNIWTNPLAASNVKWISDPLAASRNAQRGLPAPAPVALLNDGRFCPQQPTNPGNIFSISIPLRLKGNDICANVTPSGVSITNPVRQQAVQPGHPIHPMPPGGGFWAPTPFN